MKARYVKRGVYYAARLILSQFGTEIDKQDYGGLKKVYTIWICMNPPESVKNTIIGFNLGMKIIAGEEKRKSIESAFKKSDYDLLSKLYASGRGADLERAAKDKDYMNKLFNEFKL